MTGYEPQQRAALNKFENILRDMYEQTLLALKDPGDPTAGITELTPEQRTDTVVSFAVLGVDMDKSIHKANTILSRLSSSTEEPVAEEPVADEPVADEPVADSYNPYVDYMRSGHKSY
jgi:acetate kinase